MNPLTEPSVAREIWEAAKLAGPFGTMLTLFILYHCNKERVKYRDERDGLLERVLTTFNDGTEASKDMSRALTNYARGRNNAGPTDA